MANEKRLIDANALKSQITRYHMSLKPRYITKLVDAEIGDVIDIIDEEPTVDAVEVIRCKDCRFIIDRADGTHGCYRNFVEDCKIDDFCSCGERREVECD